MGMVLIQAANYWLSEHPNIVGFRWSHAQSWGATWSFLFTSIPGYVAVAVALHLLLLLLVGRRGVPLGVVPAVHSLSMALISAVIFAGTLASAAAEIRETRWIWGRSKTPLQWLLCFPLGTRPSGRVFFWSYAFYLSRFLHTFRTFISILRGRTLSLSRLLNHSVLILVSFLWLEFSQSLQVLEILLSTLMFSVVHGYQFWTEVGLRKASFPLVANCQVVLLGCSVTCHFGVVFLHFWKGGCNGIGAWVFNCAVNGIVLVPFVNSYVRIRWIHKNAVASSDKLKK